jgi:hypothetical protein
VNETVPDTLPDRTATALRNPTLQYAIFQKTLKTYLGDFGLGICRWAEQQ